MTEARRAYMERYNTRLVTRELPSVDALLIDARDYAAGR
jgi:hypothetical protein